MTHPTTGLILIITLLLVLISVAVATDNVTITARQTVVRAGPDSKQAILASVPQGTTLALLETRTGWYRVLLDNGREGWVAQSAARMQAARGFGLTPAVAATASGRTALVIGNAAYSEDIGALKNPGNDATDMAATLRQLGFAVTLVHDATHQRMADAIETFSLQIRPGSMGVFYYAGHGAQVGGRNYLIPLGARITAEAVVPYQAVAAEEVLARMESAGQGKSLTVMILDACRNAPFMRGWRSPLRGLAPMQATGGSLIAYATAPGSVAQDGTGRNGTYTRHLLRFMTEPNLPVELMFKQVRLAVEHETNGQQIPWEHSSLRANFYFNAVAAGPTPVTTGETPQRPVQPGASDGQALLAAERQRQEDERRRQEQLKVQAEQERVRLADQERQRREREAAEAQQREEERKRSEQAKRQEEQAQKAMQGTTASPPSQVALLEPDTKLRERKSLSVPAATHSAQGLASMSWESWSRKIPAFRIDLQPISNREFLDFVRTYPRWKKSQIDKSLHDGDYLKHWSSDEMLNPDEIDRPIRYISYFAAKAYCSAQGKQLPWLKHYIGATGLKEDHSMNIVYDTNYKPTELNLMSAEWTDTRWGTDSTDTGKRVLYRYRTQHVSRRESRNYTPEEDKRYTGRSLGFRCAEY